MDGGERERSDAALQSSAWTAMAGASLLWHRVGKGASRGEGERVRERGSSGIHFWRAQKRGREVGARGSGARLWWGCGRCMEDTSVFPRIGGM